MAAPMDAKALSCSDGRIRGGMTERLTAFAATQQVVHAFAEAFKG